MAALRDADLRLDDIDGLLINRSPSAPVGSLPLAIQRDAGFRNLSLLTCVDGEGCSAIQMLHYASMAIKLGHVSTVVCVFADARIEGASGGASYGKTMSVTGWDEWDAGYGLYGAVGSYALAANRYLARYGLDERAFGQYVLSSRKWAQINDEAFARQPLTMENYLRARWIVSPLRLLDCAYPVNGAAAVVVTSLDRSRDYEACVYVHGFGQEHSERPHASHGDEGVTGGSRCAAAVYKSAGVDASDITLCQFYDNFSFVGLQTLEDYGFCAPGEAAGFVADGHTAPGGKLPVATGGGHLSGCYLQGMTPLIEAVAQGRRRAGARQVENCDMILVTGIGGLMDYHASTILSPMSVLS